MSGLYGCGIHSQNKPARHEQPILTQENKGKSFAEKLIAQPDLPLTDCIAWYFELKKNNPEGYRINERELTHYGYYLLGESKTKDAIEVFKLIVSEYPESSNAYDSLGEGYLADGNEDLALLNYEKSVAMNPDNLNGMDQIRRIKGLELLVTDWGKEIFHFPLHFAPTIDYDGIEEVVFPKNWINPDSTNFWSYVFVWSLENQDEVTPKELEKTLKLYFDGLMEVVNKNPEAKIKPTRARFHLNKNPSDSIFVSGSLTIFDAFATQQPLDLNARVYSKFCSGDGKRILLFRFSPKPFDHAVWELLRTVRLRETVCEQ